MCSHLPEVFLAKVGDIVKINYVTIKLACTCRPSILQAKDTSQLVTSGLQMTWLNTAFHTSTWIPAEIRHHKLTGGLSWSNNN